SGSINGEERRTIKAHFGLVDFQWLPVRPEQMKKAIVLRPGQPHDPDLSDHYGPAEDRRHEKGR
ncbi:MAG TPA: hypothetical protein VI114_07685, partial [Chthoniobacterales bacterium]